MNWPDVFLNIRLLSCRMVSQLFFNQDGMFSAKKANKVTDKGDLFRVDWRTFVLFLGGIVRLKRSLFNMTDP